MSRTLWTCKVHGMVPAAAMGEDGMFCYVADPDRPGGTCGRRCSGPAVNEDTGEEIRPETREERQARKAREAARRVDARKRAAEERRRRISESAAGDAAGPSAEPSPAAEKELDVSPPEPLTVPAAPTAGDAPSPPATDREEKPVGVQRTCEQCGAAFRSLANAKRCGPCREKTSSQEWYEVKKRRARKTELGGKRTRPRRPAKRAKASSSIRPLPLEERPEVEEARAALRGHGFAAGEVKVRMGSVPADVLERGTTAEIVKAAFGNGRVATGDPAESRPADAPAGSTRPEDPAGSRNRDAASTPSPDAAPADPAPAVGPEDPPASQDGPGSPTARPAAGTTEDATSAAGTREGATSPAVEPFPRLSLLERVARAEQGLEALAAEVVRLQDRVAAVECRPAEDLGSRIRRLEETVGIEEERAKATA